MTKKLQNYVNGKMVDSAGTRFGDVFNPALGAVSSPIWPRRETAFSCARC